MATSSIMFMRMIRSSVGASVFGAIVNYGIHHRLPKAGDAVNRLMQPAARKMLHASELARLTEAIASSVHVVSLIAGLVAVVSLFLALALPARLSPTRQASFEDLSVANSRLSRPEPDATISFCLCSRVEFRSLARSASVIDRSL